MRPPLVRSPAGVASFKPYLVRAVWEWCMNHDLTPYLMVWVDGSCKVPKEFVHDSQIVLNLHEEAVYKLVMDDDAISFQARFNGAVREVWVPMSRVLAIYHRESGIGLAFDVDEESDEAGNTAVTHRDEMESVNTVSPAPKKGGSGLRRIK
ncbi:MAG: ClpXP protease specificity-enhancing factor [Zoogloeaceae bacterium]|jgi:stringent starvation protein B|nr:ClpXP protease specificity-enhancing factor [Zoogloeaceae bacterium]